VRPSLAQRCTDAYRPPQCAPKRDVLAQLTRDELVAVVERFDLAVADHRKKDELIDAVASSKKATLAVLAIHQPSEKAA